MNVIGSRPTGWWRDPPSAVREFIRDLRAFADASGDDVLVVFDIHPPDVQPGRKGGVEVGFARRRGRNAADDEIVRRLQAMADRGSVRVVTSDDDLARRALELGAPVMGAGEFRRRMDDHLA
jgi:predicted RNA-binding protein with PIN domain